MKNKNGITLIALIITIVVLLILAGVSIAVLTGENGIVNKAKYAIDEYSDAEIEEKIKLAYQEYEVAKITDSNLTMESSMKASLENMFEDTINVEKQGKSIKISFTDGNKSYKHYSNGIVKKLMDSTEMYGKLDDEGTLYLRAKNKDGYKEYLYSGSIQSNWNTKGDASTKSVLRVVIEEPIAPSSTSSMFNNCSNLETIENIDNLHTENATNMGAMFHVCNNLKKLDVSNFDTSNVTDMSNMFVSCSNLTELDVSNFDTSKVTKMNNMFDGCKKLTDIDVSGFDTHKVINMSLMFRYCGISKLDVRNFNTENVTNMGAMFHACGNITELDVSNFDTKNVTDMSNMFSACGKLRELKTSKLFIINEGTNYTSVAGRNSNNIKITVTQDTANKFKETYSNFTEDNFEIIK